MLAVSIFSLAYLGIALGKIPGLVIDRVGVALLGAVAMVVTGVVALEGAVQAIHLPTILLLYSLMIISAQLRLGGFYTRVAWLILPCYARPRIFLGLIMAVSAVLSAVLANDIVCFAFTPVLAVSLVRAGLNPLPFLIGLAVSSNIGSAATIIGNPQNMLIGQTGYLDFGAFFLWCAPPSLLALLAGYGMILIIYRTGFDGGAKVRSVDPSFCERMDGRSDGREVPGPVFDRWQTLKGMVAVVMLVALFFTDIPREYSAISIAGVLLCSRKMKTRDIMGLVDWHLITLFCSLFIIIHGMAGSGYLERVMAAFTGMGMSLDRLPVLTGVSALLSNLFSNVPAAMLLISFLDPAEPVQWHTLAVSSTFAGNLFLLGSIANLIVVEQASVHGIRISFLRHAAVGVPVTLISLLILWGWFAIL
jgi:Na+/H+ antiporter NhaD/arsenite permease-like protein